MSTARRRPGRRGADAGNRGKILAAAAKRFTELGFRATTIRGVAADAGVDPALVHYFFGTKEQLFAQAMALPLDPGAVVEEMLAPGVDGVGRRLAARLLQVLDETAPANPVLALIRSATAHESAATMLREFLTAAVLNRITAALDVDRAELRAALCASQVVGLIVAREVVGLPALRTTDRAVLAGIYGDTLQRYLTEPL
ncbi:transcriptional regulator, TetR family [Pseudonocardia thermophila]|jgi:Transcriptional regulator|uniref:Transcriptional regulator, TetR family n=1 Tax=Pseudonocardia thermophila TaxID=1848 RepID=A0A1M6PCF2_PSETH|nr:TetR family transcriptional regulator [Pseudonocardia thermophila]SHK05628.1 transcriptional regulator, TetR family [Pseudonocardia thermophila]